MPVIGLADRADELLQFAGRERKLAFIALAAADYSRCLALAPTTRNIQFATVRPLLGLSRLALSAGRLPEAERHTAAALQHNPRDREALLSALFLSRAVRGAAGIDDFVKHYVATFGDSSEMRQMLSEVRR